MPSREDVYTMQVAHEARYAFAKKRPAFASKDYVLTFGRSDAERTAPGGAVTPEEAAAQSKAMIRGALGEPHKTTAPNGEV